MTFAGVDDIYAVRCGDRGANQEHRPMSIYVQMWFPLFSIVLTAAICFGVVSFIMGHAKPQRNR
jgi:hypothetical protein